MGWWAKIKVRPTTCSASVNGEARARSGRTERSTNAKQQRACCVTPTGPLLMYMHRNKDEY